MARMVLLLALCVLPALVSDARYVANPLVLEGKVYCDTCRAGYETALTTPISASVFGEQKRLEPMAPERKARWRKEINWLLSVTDHIVEFAPSQQVSKDGTNMEIMTTRQRTDLHINIPALRKLDAMLMDCLDNFKDQNEFWYVSKDDGSEAGKNKRDDDKWWIPTQIT